MPSVTIAHRSRIQVHDSQKQSDEHDVGVVVADGIVKSRHDVFRTVVLCRQRAEQTVGNCHQKRGGNTFSGHIPDAEQQLVITHIVVEQVAANILGWHLQTFDVYYFSILVC